MHVAHVLWIVCGVVGVATLWTLLVLAVWVAVVTTARRRARRAQAGRRRSWDDVPTWVAGERCWAVTVVLLSAPMIAHRTHRFVHFDAHEIDWPGLLLEASTWSPRDRLLVGTAYDLCGGSGGFGSQQVSTGQQVTLRDLVVLAEEDVDRVQAAVDLQLGRCDFQAAVTRAGGLG